MHLVFSFSMPGLNRIGKRPSLDEPWMTGFPRLGSYPSPLRFEIDPTSNGDLMADYYGECYPLMSDRLIAAFSEAGCDNLQLFDAEIYDPIHDKLHTHYKAVNILGLVSCVDREKSKILVDDGMLAMSFDGFTIDPVRAAGKRLFRLEENVSVILVSEEVVDRVEAKEIPGVGFVYTENWAV